MSTRKSLALAVAAVLFAPSVAFAGTAITSLSELAETAASGDQAVVVDVSDTSMAASGTTKRVSVSNLVGGFADATYLRLDAANDPVTREVQFHDDIHGLPSACSATELLIDGPGIHCDAGVCAVGAIDADTDAFEMCAGGENGIAVLGGDGELFPICESSGATDISSMFDFGEGEAAGDVRACVFDLGGNYVTILLPTTWLGDCAVLATMAGFDPPLYDDPDYFTLDPATCTWSYTPDAGLSAAPGWTNPPTVSGSGDGTAFVWAITDAGDLSAEDASVTTLAVNATKPSAYTMYAYENWTMPVIDGDGNAPAVLGFLGEGNCSTADCFAVGVFGRVTLSGTGDYAGSYGVSATAAYDGSGTANYINGGWLAAAHYGTGAMSSANAMYGELFVMDDGDITDGTVALVESPTIDGDKSGSITNNRGIWIRDQSCDHNDCDVDRVGAGYGIYIDAFSDADDYGITSGTQINLWDDVPLTFGNDEDASILYDETTDDEFKVLFGAAERINVDSTGIAFNGATPVARPDYTTSNCNTDRAFDANATTTEELADVLCTLIADLEAYGLVQ